MKKTFASKIALVLALVLVAVQLPFAALTAAAETSFTFSEGNWDYNEQDSCYTSGDVETTAYFSGDFASGLSFDVRNTVDSDWMLLSIGSYSAVCPEGDGFYYDFCHGTGLKMLLKRSGSVEVRLITTVGGWDSKAWSTSVAGLAEGGFNDGDWNNVTMVKHNGKWKLVVGGTDLLQTMTAKQRTTLDTFMGDGDITVLLGFNGNHGTADIRESEYHLPITAENLTFNNKWTLDDKTGIYTSQPVDQLALFSGDFANGLGFDVRHQNQTDWLLLSIGAYSSVCPEGDGAYYDFLHGTGLKLMLNDTGSISARLITKVGGWDTDKAWETHISGVTGAFNDGEWKNIRMVKKDGVWKLIVCGVDILASMTDSERTVLNGFMGTGDITVVLGCNQNKGTADIREAEYYDSVAAKYITFNNKWTLDDKTGVYTSAVVSQIATFKGDFASDLSFEFNHTNEKGFALFSIGSEASLFQPEDAWQCDFNHGTGLKLMLNDSGSVEARLITEVGGWDSYAWNNHISGVATAFNDGKWHTVRLSKRTGDWELFVDGTEILSTMDSSQRDILNALMGSGDVMAIAGVNGNDSTVKVREGAKFEPVFSENLTFNEQWTLDNTTGVYTSNNVDTTALFTGDFASGLTFQVKHTNQSDWISLAIGANSAVCPEGDGFFYDFMHGTGIRLLLKDQGGAEARLVTEVGGWESSAWANSVSGLAAGGFNDGAWHTVRITKATGEWKLYVDGTDLFANMTAAQRTVLEDYMGDGDITVLLGCNGNNGTAQIREVAELDPPETRVLNFNGKWDYDEATGAYVSQQANTVAFFSADFAKGQTFEIKHNNAHDWIMLNIGAYDSVCPADDGFYYDFMHGTGIKLMLQDSGSVETRLIDTVGAWNSHAYRGGFGAIAPNGFNDNEWHKVRITKATGIWRIFVDGVDVLAGMDDEQLTKLDELMGDGDVTVLLGANGTQGWSATASVRPCTTDYRPEDNILTYGTGFRFDETVGAYVSRGFGENRSTVAGDLAAGQSIDVSNTNAKFLLVNIGAAEKVLAEPDYLYKFDHNTGLKLRLKTDRSAEVRLITDDTSWNEPAFINTVSSCKTSAFNDGNWHNIQITKHTGVWKLFVDGEDILAPMDDNTRMILDEYLDENPTITFGGESTDTCAVREAAFAYEANDLLWLKEIILTEDFNSYADLTGDGNIDVRDLVRMKKLFAA